MAKNKFLIIDGNALIHRGFHAMPNLRSPSGEPTGAIFGFASILLKAIVDLKPKYVVSTFDLDAPTFRHKKFTGYKAKRVRAPDELYEQIPRVKEVCKILSIPYFEKKGFEADDLIATISKKLQNKKDIETYIVTGDLDTLQLVSDKVKVYAPRKGFSETQVYDKKKILERYNITPEQVIDFKAIKGDPSDNIPGVAGIGEIGASKLISEYKNLEGVYKNLDKLPERTHKLLETDKKAAFDSRELVTLIDDIKIKFDLSNSEFGGWNKQKVLKLFQELGFRSLMDKLARTNGVESQKGLFSDTKTPSKDSEYKLIDKIDDLKNLCESLKKQKYIAIDTETRDLEGECLGLSVCFEAKKAFFVSLGKGSEISNIDFSKFFKPILEDQKIKKTGHNLKYDYKVLSRIDIILSGISFDSMIASYLINPGIANHSLDQVAFSEIGQQKQSISELTGQKKDIDLARVPIKELSDYACRDADLAFQISEKLQTKITDPSYKYVQKLLTDVELPLVPVLADMEINGIEIDTKILKKLSGEATKEIAKLTKQIHKLAGKEFNIASPLQLKKILFDKLKISTEDIKKGKTGLSTAASELEKMRGRHEIIDLLLQYRELAKLLSTYLNALPKLVGKDRRLHTSFNQTITTTGRLSSSDPNLQNIPIRSDFGAKIRGAFVAPRGKSLISLDYSQVELRVAAALSHDPMMEQAFKKNEDIHTATASKIFHIDLDKVTKEQRRIAKTVNFGVLYGMNFYGLANRLGISREQAMQFIKEYFEAFAGVYKYTRDVVYDAEEKGYVETILGRRRYIPEIQAGAQQMKKAAEREAINMPIQGTAADIMKLAMIAVYNEFLGTSTMIVLQIHDELLLEVPDKDVKKVAGHAKELMESVFALNSIRLVVDAKAGKDWLNMKEVK